jgi:hypothetical protein
MEPARGITKHNHEEPTISSWPSVLLANLLSDLGNFLWARFCSQYNFFKLSAGSFPINWLYARYVLI